MKQVTIKVIKQGDYLRFTLTGPVYIRKCYDRTVKKFEVVKADDINHSRLVKGDKPAYIDFTY